MQAYREIVHPVTIDATLTRYGDDAIVVMDLLGAGEIWL